MKKIISLIVFIAALIFTWNVIHTSAAVGFETHSGIQAELAEIIKNTLATKKPMAKDLSITKLWTEALNDNKVRAVFSFKFVDVSAEGETLEQVIEGEAVLHRLSSTDSSEDKWTLQSVKTTNDVVTFTEGSVIAPGMNTEESLAPSPTSTPLPEASPEATQTVPSEVPHK